MDIFLDTNVYIAWFANYETLKNLRAKEVVRSIMLCNHQVIFSKKLENELKKKSEQHNFNYEKLLIKLKKLKKTDLTEDVSKKEMGVTCVHYPDNYFIALCKKKNVAFVSFDDDAAECSNEVGVKTYSMDNTYEL